MFLIGIACGGRETPRDPLTPPVYDAATALSSSPAEALPPDAALKVAGPVELAVPKDASRSPSSPAGPRETHRIISIRLVGSSEVELLVEGGSRQGIRADWEATLVDANDRPVAGELRIVSVAREYTNLRGVLHLTVDQLKDKQVRLSLKPKVIRVE
jgi:hypothetical protein